MNLLTMEHISKTYTERVLLDDVSFSINENDKIGVIGVNGMGKSTLLKILAGVEEYDAGSLVMGNHVKIGYLPQSPAFSQEATVLSAVVDGNIDEMERWTMEAEAKSMLNRLGFSDYEEKTAHMSGGQKKRIALVRTLLHDSDILVLDEPTNHLDNAMSEWLEEYLIAYRGTIVMVTHDRYFLDRVVNRIVEVDKGKLYTYPGSYSAFVQLKEERQNMELATERKRKSLLRTELQWLMRGARARSTKQKAHIDRIHAMQEIADIQEEKRVQLSSIASRMGKKTVELNGIGKSFVNADGSKKEVIREYSYIFLRDDRIGIIGPNGCGKTTLLKILTGVLEPDTGTVEIGQTIKIGYFSQENEYMDPSMLAIDYIKEVGEFIPTAEGPVSASNLMERFLFDGATQWSRIEKLSGGEKRRLYLMRILMGAPNVLILDEPTNDLDIQTLTILEDYLDAFDGIIIIVSHDRYFLDRTVGRIFCFEPTGEIKQYEGNYSAYLIRKELDGEEALGTESLKASSNRTEGDTRSGDTRKPREKKLKFSFNEQREYETIDEDIAALEDRISGIDADMAANATKSGRLNELMKEKEAAEEALAEKMDRWVYLNELKERIDAQ